ncbi:MAG: GGDEF domain-containing protein [Anaerolineaceae bacterium]
MARNRIRPRKTNRLSAMARLLDAPHRQIGVLLLLAIVIGSGVLSFQVIRLQQSRTPISVVQERLIPAQASLAESHKVLEEVTPRLLSALLVAPGERATLVARISVDYTKFSDAFASYRRKTAGFPNELALQAELDSLLDEQYTYSVGLLAVPEVSAAQVSRYAQLSVDIDRVLSSLSALYAAQISAELDDASSALGPRANETLAVEAAVVAVLLFGGLFAFRSMRRSWVANQSWARQNVLEAKLHRALALPGSESTVYETVAHAIDHQLPGIRAEMLISGSNRSPLLQVSSTTAAGTGGGCPVASLADCPAAVHGQTQHFASSEDVDSCRYLRARPDGPNTAICVPVKVAGNATGVIHAFAPAREPHTFGPAREPVESEVIESLQLVARMAGDRLTVLRAFSRSETEARTDPLTGLLNRRSLERDATELILDGTPYVLAYADLDHFKLLNDEYGHDTGDKALQLFARVLRESVRPSDIPARYGGEEFVVVLPQCSTADATAILERVRSQLAASVEITGPAFTVSVGLANSVSHTSFSETIQAADAALLIAKANGRDRIVTEDGRGRGLTPLATFAASRDRAPDDADLAAAS